MPITIHKVVTRNNSLLVQFELVKKADSVLFEGIFRDLVAGRLGIDTSFGLDSNGVPTSEVKYPLGQLLEMIYNADSKQIGLTYVVAPVVSNAKELTNDKKGTIRKAS